MIYDQDGSFRKKEKGGAMPAKQLAVKPIVATSHRHRIIRGGCKTSEGWRSLANFSGRYTPGMSAAFGRLIHNALGQVDRPTRYRPTTFPRDTTFKFLIAEVQAPPHSEKLDDLEVLVKDGRSKVEDLIKQREEFADREREGEVLPEYKVTSSLRARIAQDQWADPWCMKNA